jgi:hypothetical protein
MVYAREERSAPWVKGGRITLGNPRLYKYLSLFLLAAGLTDAILTDLGLKAGLIEEANPLMNALYKHSVVGFYALKIILPLLLVILLFKRLPSRKVAGMVSVAAFIYTGILVLHASWAIIYFYWSLKT